MREFRIYLLYSMADQPYERDAIGNFIRKLNDIFREKQQDVYIRMVQCEDSSGEEDICSAQMFVTLSCNGGEAFDTALKHFREAQHPAILTFFHEQISEAASDFKDQLASLHGHYFTVYADVENVQHKILMQLMLVDPDLSVTIENGKAWLSDQAVLKLDNLPLFIKNQDFQELKAELSDCYEEYLDAKRSARDPDNDPKVARKRRRWETARNDVQEMENKLFSIALSFERQAGKMAMTSRQKAAYAAMEQGDTEKANAILDLEEIMGDVRHKTAMANALQSELCLHIDEFLQKIAILESQPFSAQRQAQVLEIYRRAIEVEETYNLPKRAMLEYLERATTLPIATRKETVGVARRYLLHARLSEDTACIAQAYYLLGNSCYLAREDGEAIAAARKAQDLYAGLADADPNRYLEPYALALQIYSSCLLVLTCEDAERIEVYQKILQIYEKLERRSPGKYLTDLGNCYSSLGNAYWATNKETVKAEAMFIKAVELELEAYRSIPKSEDDRLRFLGFRAYSQLYRFYRETDPESGRAEAHKEEYIRQVEEIAQQDPAKLSVLSDFYKSEYFGLFHDNKLDAAKKCLEQMAAIWENYPGAESSEEVQKNLAFCHNCAGELFSKMEDFAAAESAYLDALHIWVQLKDESKVQYLRLSLAEIYVQSNRFKEAEDLLVTLKPHYRKSLERYHTATAAGILSDCCALLAAVYAKTNRQEESQKEQKAADMYGQLTDDWAYGRRKDQGLPGPLPQ